MPSKIELGDGNSVARLLRWLKVSAHLQRLAWFTRFRAVLELWFYTVLRDDPSYLRVVEEIGKEGVREMPERFADLLCDMQVKPRDLLGKAYQEWSMNDRKRMAQYFSPDAVAAAMAQMTMADMSREQFEKPGGLTILEPAVGSGVMVIHALNEIADKYGEWGLRRTQVTMVDLDVLCCWMSLVQVAWFPGVIGGAHVFHGDSLGPPENVKHLGSIGAGPPPEPKEFVKRIRKVEWTKRVRVPEEK